MIYTGLAVLPFTMHVALAAGVPLGRLTVGGRFDGKLPPLWRGLALVQGGLLIGLSAAGLLMFHGRIAGISGIAGGIFRREAGDISWRVMFLVGLFTAGIAWGYFRPMDYRVERVNVRYDREMTITEITCG